MNIKENTGDEWNEAYGEAMKLIYCKTEYAEFADQRSNQFRDEMDRASKAFEARQDGWITFFDLAGIHGSGSDGIVSGLVVAVKAEHEEAFRNSEARKMVKANMQQAVAAKASLMSLGLMGRPGPTGSEENAANG